jgi:hypothetical protein
MYLRRCDGATTNSLTNTRFEDTRSDIGTVTNASVATTATCGRLPVLCDSTHVSLVAISNRVIGFLDDGRPWKVTLDTVDETV